MKINVNKEKFINHDCPPVTKKTWDVYWDRFVNRISNDLIIKNVESIDTIDIRINQSYEGSVKLHFYTSINGAEELHQEIWPGIDRPDFAIENKKGEFVARKTHPRGSWLITLEDRLDLKVPSHKVREKIEAVWFRIHAKEKSRKRTNELKSKWNQYINLQEFFV
jgi:hypothetical protein